MILERVTRNTADFLHKRAFYPYLTSGDAKKDREIAHERALGLMERYIEYNKPLRKFLTGCFTYEDPILEQEIFGIKFKQPCMIAAGFDKNARVFQSLAALGMNVDIGTIPRWPYEGEKRPRVFMLEDDLGSINRMRYPSEGVDAIAKRLGQKYIPREKRDYIISLNFGINQPSFEIGAPLFDLALTYNDIYELGDILTMAVSPNTPDSLGILEPENLSEALKRITNIRNGKRVWKPLLLKLIPDLTFSQVDGILDVALANGVDGFVLTNTTTDPKVKGLLEGKHKDEAGGYTGKFLVPKVSSLTRYIAKHTEGKVPLVACGGLGFSMTDLWKALTYDGACLFQFYTAFVHPKTSTPNFSYNINRALKSELKAHGFKSISEAVGAYAKSE